MDRRWMHRRTSRAVSSTVVGETQRRFAVEPLEERRLLSASILNVGADEYIVNRPEVIPFDDTVAPPDDGSIPGTGNGAPGYQIDIHFTDNSLTASQKAVFTTAANRWQAIILGELSDVTGDFGEGTVTIDDIHIDASAPAIDGPGRILGSAGPRFIRTSNDLTITGEMEFDSADVANLEANGTLDEVILHEMAHVLGLGTLWDPTLRNLISGAGGADPRYTGALATAQYQAIFGVATATVPLENTGGGGTRDAHWREGGGAGVAFDRELMTGFLDSGVVNPLSRVSLAQFADLGYLSVNINAFDVFNPTNGGNAYPTIAFLSDSPDPAPTNSSFTLTANSVADSNGTINAVRFYRETNNIPGLQILVGTVGDIQGDLLLGSDTSSAGGYTFNVSTTGLANGAYTYYAQATDNQNLVSVNVQTTHTVGAPVQSATPGTPDLVAATDTGSSNSDNITNRDNSAVAKNLQFSVSGTVAGATVSLFSGGVFVGSAIASGATTTVTTNGTTDLADGVRSITARQTESGKTESADSAALSVTIDTAAPTVDVTDVSEPRTTPVASVGVVFSQAVTGFDFNDLTLTRNGVNVPLTASNNPTSGDGGVTWTIPNLTTPTNPSGTYVLTVLAAGITDVAGNAVAVNASDTWVNSNALPTVTDVFVSGTTWAANFFTFLNTSGQGDNVAGFRLLAADHGDELPWVNLNEISVRFSENVNVAADDLVIRGVNNATYPLAASNAFTYDQFTFTATWTIAAAAFANDKILLDLDADAGTGVTDINSNQLDGEWTNPATTPTPIPGGSDTFPSGNGTPGGDFRFRLNILPGDANRSGGSVIGSDVTLVRNNQNFSPGSAGYTVFRDVNGSATILGSDVTAVRNRQGLSLPAGEPMVPTLVAPSGAVLASRKAATLRPVLTTQAAAESISLQAVSRKRLTEDLL